MGKNRTAYCISKEEVAQYSWIGQDEYIRGRAPTLVNSNIQATTAQVPESKQMIPSHKIMCCRRFLNCQTQPDGGGTVMTAQAQWQPSDTPLPLSPLHHASVMPQPGTQVCWQYSWQPQTAKAQRLRWGGGEEEKAYFSDLVEEDGY